MMKPKFALTHDFLSVHHEYFVGTFASILLCPPPPPPPHFQMSGYATVVMAVCGKLEELESIYLDEARQIMNHLNYFVQ